MPIRQSDPFSLVPPAPALTAREWGVLVTEPADGAFNMALDEALMDRAVRDDRWLLRVYGWSAPTISFGRHQAAARLYDNRAIALAGYGVVRRPTGGRAILHHRELTYAVAAPLARAGALAESYGAINQLIRGALRCLGVPAELSRRGRAMSPGPLPCFDHPSSGELVAGGRKIAGSAQWRSRDALLQHGSILIDDDQPVLCTLLKAVAPPPPAAATLRQFLARVPSLEDMAAALTQCIVETGGSASPMPIDSTLASAARMLQDRYRSADWTWRR